MKSQLSTPTREGRHSLMVPLRILSVIQQVSADLPSYPILTHLGVQPPLLLPRNHTSPILESPWQNEQAATRGH